MRPLGFRVALEGLREIMIRVVSALSQNKVKASIPTATAFGDSPSVHHRLPENALRGFFFQWPHPKALGGCRLGLQRFDGFRNQIGVPSWGPHFQGHPTKP